MTTGLTIYCLISSTSERTWQIQVTLKEELRYFYTVANFLQYMNVLEKQYENGVVFLWELEAGTRKEHFEEIEQQMHNASALLSK